MRVEGIQSKVAANKQGLDELVKPPTLEEKRMCFTVQKLQRVKEYCTG